MKNIFFLLSVLVLFSCNGGNTAQEPDFIPDEVLFDQEKTDESHEGTMEATSLSATIDDTYNAFYLGHSYRITDREVEGKPVFEYVERLKMGWELSHTGEIRSGIYNGDEYVFVEFLDKLGRSRWTLEGDYVPSGQLGVVVGQAASLYSDADYGKITNDILPSKSLVLIHTTDNNNSSEFYKIHATIFDGEGFPRLWNKYIARADVSIRTADVQSIIPYYYYLVVANNSDFAKTAAGVAQMKNYLDLARGYGSSVFISEIDQAYKTQFPVGSTSGSALSESDFDVVSYSDSGFINDDRVNIRNLPTTSGSTVMGQLNNGDDIVIIARTESKVSVQGMNDYWYKISSPVRGWVFGEFVTLDK
jgi:hypothetical protein